MVKKEFKFYGKSFEEVKKMSLEEFMQIIPARQRRSLKRGFTESHKIFLKSLRNKGDNVKTHIRDLVIIPELVGKTIHLHRGNKFEKIVITQDMLGHFLGEFTYTRSKVTHSAPGIGATRSSSAISVK